MTIIRVIFTDTPRVEKTEHYPYEETLEEWLEEHPEVVFVGNRFYLPVQDLDELFMFVESSCANKEVILFGDRDNQGYLMMEIYNGYRE